MFLYEAYLSVYVAYLGMCCVVVAEPSIERIRFAKAYFGEWDSRQNQEPKYQEFVNLKNYNPEPKSDNKYLSFSAFGKNWKVNLQRNDAFLGKNAAVETRDTTDGRTIKSRSFHRDCFYIGDADAGPNEQGLAAFTFCDNKTMGYIISNINDYLINPIIAKPASGQRKRDLDYMYKMKRTMEKFGPEINTERTKRYVYPDPKYNWDTVHLGPQYPPDGRVLHYEIAAIMDDSYKNDYYDEVVNSEEDLILHVEQIFHFGQLWYLHPTLGFRVWIHLQKLIFLDNPFPESVDNYHSKGMVAACKWQAENFPDSHEWDDVVMFSNRREMWGGIGGVSNPSAACGNVDTRCCGVASQNNWMMATTLRTVVHETAHGLGMPDDYRWPTSELCYTGLMRYGVYEDHDWSRCSVQRFENFLNVKVTDCVQRKNTPSIDSDTKLPSIPVNVAWRSEVEQSSTNGRESDWGAWHATDGSIAGLPIKPENATLGSCTMTKPEKDPWIRIALDDKFSQKEIKFIHIFNREDCCGERLHNFEVRVGKDREHRNNPLCSYHQGVVPGGKHGMVSVTCNTPLSGKYVSVQIIGQKEILTVCEIYVYQDIEVDDFKPKDTPCKDTNKHCPDWKFSRTCENPNQFHNNNDSCRYQCGLCKIPNEYPPMKPDSTSVELPGFTCVDRGSNCWHKLSNGRCQKNDVWCRRACLNCGDDKTTTTTATTATTATTTRRSSSSTTSGSCIDENRNCPGWASESLCDLNPGYMLKYCRQSCRVCDDRNVSTTTATTATTCSDNHEYCDDWARAGHCESSSRVLKECPKSCNKC